MTGGKKKMPFGARVGLNPKARQSGDRDGNGLSAAGASYRKHTELDNSAVSFYSIDLLFFRFISRVYSWIAADCVIM
jgi:hypothetical protein